MGEWIFEKGIGFSKYAQQNEPIGIIKGINFDGVINDMERMRNLRRIDLSYVLLVERLIFFSMGEGA